MKLRERWKHWDPEARWWYSTWFAAFLVANIGITLAGWLSDSSALITLAATALPAAFLVGAMIVLVSRTRD